MADLITYADAVAAIGASLPPGYATVLPGAISAASEAIQKFTGRDFVVTTYDDVYSSAGFSAIQTRQYPVTSIARLSVGLQTVLSVSNTNGTLNQRATAELTSTVSDDALLTVTGIKLVRVASGVTYTDSTTLFATYPTLATVASHINGLGNGWTATAATGYTLWPSADLRPVQGAQGALNSSGGMGAQFQAFTNDVTCFTVDSQTGRIQFNAQQWDPVFSLMNLGASPLTDTFPAGFDVVRVVYTAGYPTVPYDVQRAALLTTQSMVWKSMRPTFLDSETAKDYSYKINDKANSDGIPEAVVKLLTPWRAYRRY